MSWAAEQAAAIDELAACFDVTADWLPSQGGQPVTGQPVMFDAPSLGLGLDAPGAGIDTRFDYTNFIMTANASAFPGLKPAVDAGCLEEIQIDDGGEGGRYHVRSVRYVGDGKLIEARLSEVTAHAQQDRGQPDPAIAGFFTR